MKSLIALQCNIAKDLAKASVTAKSSEKEVSKKAERKSSSEDKEGVKVKLERANSKDFTGSLKVTTPTEASKKECNGEGKAESTEISLEATEKMATEEEIDGTSEIGSKCMETSFENNVNLF